MWFKVMRLEWRILKRDRSALLALALFAAFLVAASLAGGRQADLFSEGIERSQAEERARFDSHARAFETFPEGQGAQSEKDPRNIMWMGKQGAARLAALPPAPLAPLAVGQRDLNPQVVRITTEVLLTAERETETAISGPSRLTTGGFDPAFLFVVLFPLLVIALSYDLLSAERERGTLAMLLSQPVSQRSLVLGKAGARALGLLAVTLVSILLGLLLAGADLGAEGALAHVALMAAVLVASSLFWFALSVAVGSAGGTSARNALTMVGVWLVLVVIVPGLVHVTVDTLYPPASRMELLHEAREAAQEVEKKVKGIEGRHDVDTSSPDYAKKLVASQRELALKAGDAFEELRQKTAQRQRLMQVLRFVSPAIVVQLALEDVAGSGAARHLAFDAQSDAFHERYRDHFFSKVEAGESMTAAGVEQVPRFTFVKEPVSQVAGRILFGALVLLLAALALIGLAWPRLKRVGRLTR